ncbi:AAA-ATPase [Corynebacterium phage PSonyx]|nr:AAA-ATPase [Corynebacterium phage PSonyx]
MENTIISTGNTYRIFSDAVKTHNTLPADTFTVVFNEMTGYSLEKAPNLNPGTEKLYGNHQKRLDRITSTYSQTNRSLGILLSGDKGMGKTLMLKLIAHQAQTVHNLPVILVTDNTPGIVGFLDTLGEACIIFDEFEKTFIKGHVNEGSEQDQFLTLFDGTSTTRRMYAMSVNKLHQLSDYMVNRPGRFHYHMRFDYPTQDEIRQYFTDQAPQVSTSEVDKVVEFSSRTHLNYDHLRAICFELVKGDTFNDFIDDLNIKSVDEQKYRVEVTTTTGKTLVGETRLDPYSSNTDYLYVRSTDGHEETVLVKPALAPPAFLNGKITFPAQALKFSGQEHEDLATYGIPHTATFELQNSQNSYTFF